MNGKLEQDYKEENSANWKPESRRPLFKTLKRRNENSGETTPKSKRSANSSKRSISRENRNTENQMPNEISSCYNSASEDLFQRSVIALEQRSHRTNLIPDPLQPDDIPYCHPQKRIKNYKPPSERVTESAENRKKFCNNYIEEVKERTKDDCPFAPTIISKQTNQTHDIFTTARKVQKEEEKPKISPVINQKSKEIADRLTNSTTIYTRQSSKIYHNPKSPNEDEKNNLKIPQKEIDKLIVRLTSHEEQNLSSDSEENDKYRNTTIDKKTIERLVLDSIHKNQSRSKFGPDSNTYKPDLNQKSVKIANHRSPKGRDLYTESLISFKNKEKKAAILKNYKEMQDMQECTPFHKMSQNPSYLNHVNNSNLRNVREQEDYNQIQPLEPYIFEDIEQKPFSFDKLSKKKKFHNE